MATSTLRDGWDWLTFWLTIVGATTATILFWSWTLERRRRPEARIVWFHAEDCQAGSLREWSETDIPRLGTGETLLVRAAMRNIGDAIAESVLTNFVAATCLTLTDHDARQAVPASAGNLIAGLPPDNSVTYFGKATTLAGGDWLIRDYLIERKPNTSAGKARVLFDLSCPRFNARGRRWLPSFVFRPGDEEEFVAAAGTKWPPAHAMRRWPRCIHAMPRKRVVCMPGGRRDVRDIDLTP
jgi:hypothetical protein